MSKTFIMWLLAIPLLIGIFYFVKLMFPTVKEDNVVEEFIEKVIEDNTGLKNVDLSPSSPEEQKPM